MSPEIENPNIVAQELVESYGRAHNLLIDNGWGVSKDEYTNEASSVGLTESHIWSIWLGDDASEEMENLWLNDKLESLENYPPHIARGEAYNILKEGGWDVYWDDTPLGQGFINWFIYSEEDVGSGIVAAWMSEDIIVSPNRPLGILLSIGIIAWFVKILRK
jgi:hypothetical protein